MIILDNVTKIYHDTVYAVRDVSLNVEKGDLCFIVGPSGAGKTTILKLMFGLERPSRGMVSMFGRKLEGLDASSIQAIRRHTGFVFQDFKLIEDWTVFNNAAIILEILGKPAVYVRGRVWRMLKWVGLQHKVYERAKDLSGGERQRLALVRAMIHDPDILLADEPVGNLDETMARYMMNVFLKLNKKGTTIIIASHHGDPLMEYAKVIQMDRGSITGAGN
ncbi:MAG: ATP-binding cassette domain-containing protein [Desulfomonilia bacterium]|jgi:cell division transport system ATP-binding protein